MDAKNAKDGNDNGMINYFTKKCKYCYSYTLSRKDTSFMNISAFFTPPCRNLNFSGGGDVRTLGGGQFSEQQPHPEQVPLPSQD
jgi:hypothetical protein